MDYTNTFLSMLQEGTPVEDIAEALTKNLNAANQEFQKQQKAKEANRANKIAAVRNLFDGITGVLKCWDLVDDEEALSFTESDVEDIVDEVDGLIPLLKKRLELEELLREIPIGDSKVNPKPEVTKKNDPIEDFLNKFVRN